MTPTATDTHFYPAGTVIAFENGEYSDFGIIGHVVAMKDLRLAELIEQAKAEHKPENSWDDMSPSKFVSWLVIKELAFPASVSSVHIGSYGKLEL